MRNRPHGLLTVAALAALTVVAAVIGLALAGGRGKSTGVATPSAAAPTQLPSASSSTPLPEPVRLTGSLPPAREGAAMAYDALRRQVVLFGGGTIGSAGTAGASLIDTWTFQGRVWTPRDPPVHPPAMAEQLMVYDARTMTCVLVGVPEGSNGPAQTWDWDGTSWTRVADVPTAAFEIVQGFAFDWHAGQAVLLTWVGTGGGGPYIATHTWTWDGGVWSLQHPVHDLPVGRSAPRMADLGVAGKAPYGVLLVNGDSSGMDTWRWSGTEWTAVDVETHPAYDPLGATMAQDPTTGDVVLIGLEQNLGGETWLWNGSVWREDGAAPAVDSLYGGTTLLADGYAGHVIVIGDSGRPNRFGALWLFDGKEWVSDRSG